MRRWAQQFLLATFVALYGAMAAYGPALHSLVGNDHVGTAAHDGGEEESHSSPHECPICLFLTHGQIAGDPAYVPTTDVVGVQPADDLPLSFPAAIRRPSSPRAPPLA